MIIPLQDLNGPQRKDAERIVRYALMLDSCRADALDKTWSETPGELYYLKHCKIVWDALEESGRFLPMGWFEAIFTDCQWMESTRALHPIADVVCATLVKDLIPEQTYDYLSSPWNSVVTVSVN